MCDSVTENGSDTNLCFSDICNKLNPININDELKTNTVKDVTPKLNSKKK